MTEEKEVKKEAQKEVDLKLLELIEVMKAIKKEMPDFEKEERITVFLEYRREKGNHFGTEKQNMNSTNSVSIESLLNTLTFRQAKNGKSEFANISQDLGAKLPKQFDVGEYSYFNKGDALIRVRKTSKQKKMQ
ncbi:hypothetical protein B9Q01_06415 [Candidatus Marsarchaeota G1 archaeon OSP_D]|jgi:hypothetical protein|uniref:Uncharacterized protein n=2 Tax=Candidatus Marsarchaeota group 1 TaxID=2203770 RepID=A0A2R6A9A1_9ARCH|nr:MAG: hypothetical protein B9Q01_06415 [Candidatus Marsarchaeota G1 archaeon OSP_D]PSN88112.1 MAG: hypothetical protein B9Q00_06680 [Candidatus Marsarchaeota G1 archaeon OSP_C]